jgi:hypothetical protein
MKSPVLTPPQLSARWRVSPEKVISMIRSGALHGFDVSSPGSKRPRYRINISEVIAFEERRSARQPVKVARKKRQKKDSDFVKYF